MDIKKLSSYNKIKRKQFFTFLGAGLFNIAAAGSIVMKLFGKKTPAAAESVKVQINPLAISRKKVGNKNV